MPLLHRRRRVLTGTFTARADLAPALPLSLPNLEILEIHDPAFAPELDTLAPGPGLPGPDPFADPLPLLLGDPGEDGDEEIPHGPAGIEPRLLMAYDPDARCPELLYVPGHGPDPFAAQAVERPDQKHVELPPVRADEDGGQRGPVTSGPARRVHVHAHHVQAETVRPAPELVLLVGRRLVFGGDADVEGGFPCLLCLCFAPTHLAIPLRRRGGA